MKMTRATSSLAVAAAGLLVLGIAGPASAATPQALSEAVVVCQDKDAGGTADGLNAAVLTNLKTDITEATPTGAVSSTCTNDALSNSPVQVTAVAQDGTSQIVKIQPGKTAVLTTANVGQVGGLVRLHFHDCFVAGCDA